MIKVYVLSDDLESTKLICISIERNNNLKLVGYSNCFAKAVLSPSSVDKPDIIVIDQSLSGHEVSNLYNLLHISYKLIFITKMEAVDFFDSNNCDYLIKPFNEFDFQQILIKYFDEDIVKRLYLNDYFFIKCDKKRIVKIVIKNVYAIEAKENYICIHMADFKYMTNFSLNKIESLLPTDVFIRVHRSFIVNSREIISIEAKKIHLKEGFSVPIGQSYRKPVFNMFHVKLLDLKRAFP